MSFSPLYYVLTWPFRKAVAFHPCWNRTLEASCPCTESTDLRSLLDSFWPLSEDLEGSSISGKYSNETYNTQLLSITLPSARRLRWPRFRPNRIGAKAIRYIKQFSFFIRIFATFGKRERKRKKRAWMETFFFLSF